MRKENVVWGEIYSKGDQLNKYPYDQVVSFIYKNYDRNKQRKEIKILEVGCGAGNNLWFAAREGFNVTGIDISESAINFALKRFREEKLEGNFFVGSFLELPFKDNEFDFVIDRAALTYLNFSQCKKAISEINRVLKVGGKLFFNPFSDRHSSCVSGSYMTNGMTEDIKEGISECGNTFFYGRRDLYNLFEKGWNIENLSHAELEDQIKPYYFVYAEWRVVVRKLEGKNE